MLMLEPETQMLRVKPDGAGDVLHLVSSAVNRLDEGMNFDGIRDLVHDPDERSNVHATHGAASASIRLTFPRRARAPPPARR